MKKKKSIEQNVVIIAACIPTIRPLFHTVFRSNNKYKSSPSKSRSDFKPSIKLSSKVSTTGPESKVRVEGRRGGGDYAEEHSSQKGIWRTHDFTFIESDEDVEPGK